MTLMEQTGGPAVTIEVSLRRQQLRLCEEGRVRVLYPVSTSRYGPGEQSGSLCTPRGRHVIRAMIGCGLPAGAVLQGRRPTGEFCSPALIAAQPGRDWILSRILWLCGCEPGRNRFGSVDTMQRYIYIHGTNHEDKLGTPLSAGCVLMGNHEIVELYETVRTGDLVLIVD